MTLTETALWGRRGVITIAIFVSLGILSALGYAMWLQYITSHPTPPIEETPTKKFGNLPKIIFPPARVTSSNYSYSINTTTGTLPQLPKLAKVYLIPQAGYSLMSPERSRKLAEKLGFPNGPQLLSTTQFQFTDNNNGTLTIDITTANFHFQRAIKEKEPVSTDSASPAKIPWPSKDNLIQNFKSYLTSKSLLIPELANGSAAVNFTSSSPEDSESVEVSLIPADFEKLPIIPSTPEHGLVKAILTQAKDEAEKYIKVDYDYWPIDKTTSSTYPIKSVDDAFKELNAGVGFISTESPTPQVLITAVYLAYYETEIYSPYLQPVIVFEGANFKAIIPAIKNTTPK